MVKRLDGPDELGDLGSGEASFRGFISEGIGEVFLVEQPDLLGFFGEADEGEWGGQNGLDERRLIAHAGFKARAEVEGLT